MTVCYTRRNKRATCACIDRGHHARASLRGCLQGNTGWSSRPTGWPALPSIDPTRALSALPSTPWPLQLQRGGWLVGRCRLGNTPCRPGMCVMHGPEPQLVGVNSACPSAVAGVSLRAAMALRRPAILYFTCSWCVCSGGPSPQASSTPQVTEQGRSKDRLPFSCSWCVCCGGPQASRYSA